MNAPGKGFLKVTGILMVIFGAISIITAIAGIACSAAIMSQGGDATTIGGALILGVILACLGGILEFIAGIFGIKNCDKPEKSNVCLVFAIIILALNLISNIIGGFTWLSIFGYVLPILYLIGAIKNKQAA